MNYQNLSPVSPSDDCFWGANIHNKFEKFETTSSPDSGDMYKLFWNLDICRRLMQPLNWESFIAFTSSKCANFVLCVLHYRSDWTLLTLQGQWGLNSSYCPGRRVLKFIALLDAVKIVRRTEVGGMWGTERSLQWTDASITRLSKSHVNKLSQFVKKNFFCILSMT
jgi:hypothetical protein